MCNGMLSGRGGLGTFTISSEIVALLSGICTQTKNPICHLLPVRPHKKPSETQKVLSRTWVWGGTDCGPLASETTAGAVSL